MSDNGPGLGWTIAKYTMYGVATFIGVCIVVGVGGALLIEDPEKERIRQDLRRKAPVSMGGVITAEKERIRQDLRRKAPESMGGVIIDSVQADV